MDAFTEKNLKMDTNNVDVQIIKESEATTQDSDNSSINLDGGEANIGLDLLANRFYGDVSLYWIISISNPNVLDFGSLYPPAGAQLRIPVNVSGIISSYNQLNEL